MIFDSERFTAIENVRIYLDWLMDRKNKIKTGEVRERARRLSKHYPETWFMERLKNK